MYHQLHRLNTNIIAANQKAGKVLIKLNLLILILKIKSNKKILGNAELSRILLKTGASTSNATTLTVLIATQKFLSQHTSVWNEFVQISKDPTRNDAMNKSIFNLTGVKSSVAKDDPRLAIGFLRRAVLASKNAKQVEALIAQVQNFGYIQNEIKKIKEYLFQFDIDETKYDAPIKRMIDKIYDVINCFFKLLLIFINKQTPSLDEEIRKNDGNVDPIQMSFFKRYDNTPSVILI